MSRRKKYGKTLTFLGDMRFNESKILLMKIIQQEKLSLKSNKTCDSAYLECSGALRVANIRASCIIIEATFIKPSSDRKIECSSGLTRYSYTEESSSCLSFLSLSREKRLKISPQIFAHKFYHKGLPSCKKLGFVSLLR